MAPILYHLTWEQVKALVRAGWEMSSEGFNAEYHSSNFRSEEAQDLLIKSRIEYAAITTLNEQGVKPQ